MLIAFVSDTRLEIPTLAPLADLAIRRGHQVRLVTRAEEFVADAAVYCTDATPEYLVRPSFICLNGLDQGHASWPQPWRDLDWSPYDFGLLPGPAWKERWDRSGYPQRSRTRQGVIDVGWPRADRFAMHAEAQTQRPGGPEKKRVLYAPSFECDGKQEAVVRALEGTSHELWIKHWNIPELEDKYPDYFQWVSEANERARVYDHVRIIDPKTDLYDLISEVGLLVTDQSSTIYDAMAAGIPSLAVRGWPMRTQRSNSIRRLEPSQDVTFVAEVDTLRQTIEAALSADAADQVLELRGRVLTNFGTAADEILDLIELTVAAWERGAPIHLQVKPARVHRLLGPTRRVSYEVQRFARGVRSKLRQLLREEA